MRRTLFALALGAAAVLMLWAQQRERRPLYPPYEVKLVFPHEFAPGQYRQVEAHELDYLSEQGWELVSVMPYIYRNEEHGNDSIHPKPVVTQTYPAYFFKRLKILNR
jgi:hypothetical protein